MPDLTRSGNSVEAPEAPIRTCVSESPVRIRLPVPLGVMVKSSFEFV